MQITTFDVLKGTISAAPWAQVTTFMISEEIEDIDTLLSIIEFEDVNVQSNSFKEVFSFLSVVDKGKLWNNIRKFTRQENKNGALASPQRYNVVTESATPILQASKLPEPGCKLLLQLPDRVCYSFIFRDFLVSISLLQEKEIVFSLWDLNSTQKVNSFVVSGSYCDVGHRKDLMLYSTSTTILYLTSTADTYPHWQIAPSKDRMLDENKFWVTIYPINRKDSTPKTEILICGIVAGEVKKLQQFSGTLLLGDLSGNMFLVYSRDDGVFIWDCNDRSIWTRLFDGNLLGPLTKPIKIGQKYWFLLERRFYFWEPKDRTLTTCELPFYFRDVVMHFRPATNHLLFFIKEKENLVQRILGDWGSVIPIVIHLQDITYRIRCWDYDDVVFYWSNNSRIFMWDPATEKITGELELKEIMGPLVHLTKLPNNQLFTMFEEGIKVWDLEKKWCLQTITLDERPQLVFSPTKVLVSGREGRFRVFDVSTLSTIKFELLEQFERSTDISKHDDRVQFDWNNLNTIVEFTF